VAAIRAGQPHAARTHCRPPWGLRFPPASGPGFHVVLQGTCWLLPGGSDDPIQLGTGDVVYVAQDRAVALADDPSSPLQIAAPAMDDAWQPQRSHDDDVATTILMCGSYRFQRARPHPLLAELPPIVHLSRRVGHHAQLSTVIDLLGGELDRRQPGTDALLPSLLDAMLLYILRTWYLEQKPAHVTGWAAALNDPAISAALQQLHHDPIRAWTVEELGHHVGLSRAAFARKFSSLVGRPPLDYLTWWRMTIAGTLLRSSDISLRSVAQRTGYSSESAFNRAFKREYETTPAAYRRHPSSHPQTDGQNWPAPTNAGSYPSGDIGVPEAAAPRPVGSPPGHPVSITKVFDRLQAEVAAGGVGEELGVVDVAADGFDRCVAGGAHDGAFAGPVAGCGGGMATA
jgi:AraC-like DNA-binding protein